MCVRCAVDVIVVKEGKVLLVKRKREPFAGFWALPGGFIEENETAEEAAVREVMEETGLMVKIEALVDVFSEVDRDPRGRVISIVYSAVPAGGNLKKGKEVEDVKWFPLHRVPRLAFDHGEMLKRFLQYRL